jgi:CHASE3 domain sensor protein
MSDPLAKAEAAVTEATSNTDLVQQIVIALQVQQALNGTQQQPSCQHQQSQFDTKKWLTIGGLACVGACVACALAFAFALASIALAIGGTCATACLLVLRSMWRDFQRGR